MPKKTKRAKLIAEYRRKLQLLQEPSVSFGPQRIVNPPVEKTSVVSFALPTDEFKSIRKELLTTIGIVSLFFILEFGLWRLFG